MKHTKGSAVPLEGQIIPRRISAKVAIASLVASYFLAFCAGRASSRALFTPLGESLLPSLNKKERRKLAGYRQFDKVPSWLAAKREMLRTKDSCAIPEHEAQKYPRCSLPEWGNEEEKLADLKNVAELFANTETEIKASQVDNAAYYEALVHPSMFAHTKPKQVVIVGGGEGAVIYEVLKHRTLEKAIAFEIDPQLAREHLREWSDCDLVGSPPWCTEDPRATVLDQDDAFAWFLNRYSDNETASHEPIDVIIMNTM